MKLLIQDDNGINHTISDDIVADFGQAGYRGAGQGIDLDRD